MIGKGRILLDGSLSELKKRCSQEKTLTVDYSYNGKELNLVDGMTLHNNIQGHAVISIDTSVLSISEAISNITSQAEIYDLSLIGTTGEEMVVSLYKEFGI